MGDSSKLPGKACDKSLASWQKAQGMITCYVSAELDCAINQLEWKMPNAMFAQHLHGDAGMQAWHAHLSGGSCRGLWGSAPAVVAPPPRGVGVILLLLVALPGLCSSKVGMVAGLHCCCVAKKVAICLQRNW